ncbi:hypothetical protein HYDPIDRAFT_185266 [Hydnomerulius pinastri MD-312]|nr:hypothetical protein HYDPIDRAFT_185266 [Hydnomerulius pinastri MD-312]
MALHITTNLNTQMSRSTTPSPAPLPSPRMPHVFVIPPEEEQQDNPPWCCFDADELPDNNGDFPSNPDIHFLDVPYLLQQQQPDLATPVFRRGSIDEPAPRVVMPKKLEKKQRPESVRIIENKNVLRGRQRDAREDSDVIEVVKVKRSKEALADPEENTKMKRSKTFKARATKALQSIKNVGKSSRKPHVKELWTSSESMPGIFKGVQEQIRQQQEQMDQQPPATPNRKGSLSRRNSRSLSQMFQSVKAPRPESPLLTRTTSPTLPPEPPHMLPSATSSSLAYLKNSDTSPSVNEALTPATTDEMVDRPASPSPSVKKNNRRFSVLELHKLFSFSSSSPDDPSPASAGAPFPPPRNISVPSTSTSTMSSDYPDVPVEEGAYAAVHFLDLDKADQKLVASRYHQAMDTDEDELPLPRRPRDFSFEMRLDSLHFDSLSFDPEEFDVSMEGNVFR